MQQEQIKLNLSAEQLQECPTVTCECGCKVFVPGTAFKKVPGFLTGQGLTPTFLPLQGIMVCAKCGELAPFCKEDERLQKLLNSEKCDTTDSKEKLSAPKFTLV